MGPHVLLWLLQQLCTSIQIEIGWRKCIPDSGIQQTINGLDSLFFFREGDREQKAEEQSVKGTFVHSLFLLSNGKREIKDCWTG